MRQSFNLHALLLLVKVMRTPFINTALQQVNVSADSLSGREVKHNPS